MAQMKAPDGQVHEIVAAGVGALKALGWSEVTPAPAEKPEPKKRTAKKTGG